MAKNLQSFYGAMYIKMHMKGTHKGHPYEYTNNAHKVRKYTRVNAP
jgi:hypothetical protein